MGILVVICAFLLFARAESYVLLTANVDDLHAIANQLAKSPVVDHLKDIWRRASQSFESQYSKFRAEDESGMEQSNEESQERRSSDEMRTQRRKAIENLVQLGRNASVYLKQMFENL